MASVQTKPRGPFIESCLGLPTRRVPIWIMRQSSRYLPEYRELRGNYSYRDVCTNPELAAEATLQPVRRFGLDAGILFTDPLLLLEPLGVDIEFSDSGPLLSDPVRSRSGVQALRFRGGIPEELGYLKKATTLATAALGEVPLIAVAGGPFTLAGQLVEGRTARSHRHLKSLLYNDPAAAHELMANLADLITEAVSMQLAAGASAFILYDSWAGLLTPKDFREHVSSFLTDIFRRVQMYRKPGIIYVNECGHLVDSLVRTGAHVLGLDWRVDLELMRTRLPENISIQGNLDPSVLLGPPDLIRQRVLDILIPGTLYRGHVFNLGGGILPDTPTENVQVLVEIVRDFDPNLQGWRSVRA